MSNVNPVPNLTFTFRPCIPSDLPTVAALLNHWIANSLAILATSPRPLSWWTTHFSYLRSKNLPFILCIASRTSSPPPSPDHPTFPIPNTPEILLGYTYASPYNPYPGFESTVDPSTYVSPSARLSGVGTALTLFLSLILKFPTRWPEYGCAPLDTEERRIRRVVGWMTVDEDGVGKGKLEGFLEKMKRDAGIVKTPLTPVPGVGRKWGRDLGIVSIWFDLEAWKPDGEIGMEGDAQLRRLGWRPRDGEERGVKVKL